MIPLAHRLRPKNFDDIVGQDILIGKNGIIRRMIEQNKLFSFILYGKAGGGKTTIASVIKNIYYDRTFFFNASTDNKAKLKSITERGLFLDNIILIIDEIHRMKKDIQDFLLPFIEDGTIILIGLTTENPYRSVNPAIRSRCHIFKMKEINSIDLRKLLEKATLHENEELPTDDILEYIISASSLEIRTALNMLEVVFLLERKERTLENVKSAIGIKNISVDQNGENYYDILSAMIKSIRGSDTDAALHYLARFIQCEDLEMLTRRLLISAYEDIGFGNPQIGPRVYAACQTALKVGLPEARIPLAYAVIDLATSPKSNSSYNAINSALKDLENLHSMSIPKNILNKEIKGGVNYLYPHDFKEGFVKQQYMPDEIFDHTYYFPKDTSQYERALKDKVNYINKTLKNK